MRIAVLSDVHGNKHALTAALAGAERQGADTLWCLGDMVGYGADPGVCAETCLALSERCIAGNHDLGLVGRVGLDQFSAYAVAGLEHARSCVPAELAERIGQLEPAALEGGGALVHGSPRDPIWEYIVSPSQAAAALAGIDTALILHGHTHVPAAWRSDGNDAVEGGHWRGEATLSLEDGPWLVNPGAVGQPRDRDPRAAWALLDLHAGTVRLFREEYDISSAQEAILAADLPPDLAARLESGW